MDVASRLTRPYALLEALAAEADRAPLGTRVLLVAPTRGEGREILRTLARHRGEWLGLEVTTVKPLALELVGAEFGEQSLTLLDDFAEQVLIDELLDDALGVTPNSDHLKELAEGAGFRAAVREAISALRLAGVEARRLTSARFGERAKRELLFTVLSRFERRLTTERVLDTARVLTRAEKAVRGGAPLGADIVLLVPGLGTRGLAGRFLAALETRGARRLPHDPVRGLPAPEGVLWRPADSPPGPLGAVYDATHEPLAETTEVTLFRAAGVTEELREVLRRVVARGIRWDDVEIVTPTPRSMGRRSTLWPSGWACRSRSPSGSRWSGRGLAVRCPRGCAGYRKISRNTCCDACLSRAIWCRRRSSVTLTAPRSLAGFAGCASAGAASVTLPQSRRLARASPTRPREHTGR